MKKMRVVALSGENEGKYVLSCKKGTYNSSFGVLETKAEADYECAKWNCQYHYRQAELQWDKACRYAKKVGHEVDYDEIKEKGDDYTTVMGDLFA